MSSDVAEQDAVAETVHDQVRGEFDHPVMLRCQADQYVTNQWPVLQIHVLVQQVFKQLVAGLNGI